MIVYALVLIVTFKTAEAETTNYLFRAFDDRQSCEIAEGEALTQAYNDDGITGFIVLHNCDDPIEIPKKS